MRWPERTAGIVLGVGLGGFVDGIVLHQVLQWHHLISERVSTATLAGMRANTLADGLFHLVALAATLLGVALLMRARTQNTPVRFVALLGWVLVGWGAFNIVEGLLNHHVLQIHHVRSMDPVLAWDLGFLGLSVLLVVAGLSTVALTPRPQ